VTISSHYARLSQQLHSRDLPMITFRIDIEIGESSPVPFRSRSKSDTVLPAVSPQLTSRRFRDHRPLSKISRFRFCMIYKRPVSVLPHSAVWSTHPTITQRLNFLESFWSVVHLICPPLIAQDIIPSQHMSLDL
jgi:hypothetical protein